MSYANLVPPIVLFLAKNPLVDSSKLVSLQTLVSAAAPLGSALTREVEDRLSVNILQGMNSDYGFYIVSHVEVTGETCLPYLLDAM